MGILELLFVDELRALALSLSTFSIISNNALAVYLVCLVVNGLALVFKSMAVST